MSEQPQDSAALGRPRVHIPFYDDVLKHTEIWIVLILLLLVVFSTFINLLDRNFQLGLWEYAVVEKMVYSGVFYIGIYGGVIAARRGKHIAIDAVATFLSLKQKRALGIVLQAIGGMTCMVLAVAVYDWMQIIIDADSTMIPGRSEWWLRIRLWRWPVAIGFAWMSLHFFVNSGRFLYDTVRPPPDEDPAP